MKTKWLISLAAVGCLALHGLADDQELREVVKRSLLTDDHDYPDRLIVGIGPAILPVLQSLLTELLPENDPPNPRLGGAIWWIKRTVVLFPNNQEVQRQGLATLSDLLSCKNLTARVVAASAFGDIGSASNAKKLLPLLEDPNAEVRGSATAALAKIATPEDAVQMEAIAARRKKGSSDEQIKHDGTIKYLEEAIGKIKTKTQPPLSSKTDPSPAK